MGGRASTSSSNTTSTTSIADSYNKSLSQVANLSDVGNVKLELGSVDVADSFPSISTFLFLGVVILAGVAGLFILFRR